MENKMKRMITILIFGLLNNIYLMKKLSNTKLLLLIYFVVGIPFITAQNSPDCEFSRAAQFLRTSRYYSDEINNTNTQVAITGYWKGKISYRGVSQETHLN